MINTGRMNAGEIRARIREMNPGAVICFTIEDIIICFNLPYMMKGTKFYYYNLEIYVPPASKGEGGFIRELSQRAFYFKNKLKEIVYVKGCQSIVIQDKLRKRVLKKYWISHPVTCVIPN